MMVEESFGWEKLTPLLRYTYIDSDISGDEAMFLFWWFLLLLAKNSFHFVIVFFSHFCVADFLLLSLVLKRFADSSRWSRAFEYLFWSFSPASHLWVLFGIFSRLSVQSPIHLSVSLTVWCCGGHSQPLRYTWVFKHFPHRVNRYKTSSVCPFYCVCQCLCSRAT